MSMDQLVTTLQKCYDEQFLPVWGYPVTLYNTDAAKPSDWQLLYVDDDSRARELGYHGLTYNKQPVATVFVKAAIANNEPVSVTASHELFEMVIDPIANLWAERMIRRNTLTKCAILSKTIALSWMDFKFVISCIPRGSSRSAIHPALGTIISGF